MNDSPALYLPNSPKLLLSRRDLLEKLNLMKVNFKMAKCW